MFFKGGGKVVSDTRNGVCVAKLGCVIECLAHRFYINDDTDVILEEVDAFLIKFWKGLKQPSPETFIASLWIGEYFLLRLKNPKSRLHGRSKKWFPKFCHLWLICFGNRKNKKYSVSLLLLFLRKL